jgi:hypothetical protein
VTGVPSLRSMCASYFAWPSPSVSTWTTVAPLPTFATAAADPGERLAGRRRPVAALPPEPPGLMPATGAGVACPPERAVLR